MVEVVKELVSMCVTRVAFEEINGFEDASLYLGYEMFFLETFATYFTLGGT